MKYSKRHNWTEEEKAWLRENAKVSIADTLRRYNEHFENKLTKDQMISGIKRFTNGVTDKGNSQHDHFWTEEEIKWMKDNVKGVPFKELYEKYISEFKTDVGYTAFHAAAKRYTSGNGIVHRFQPGRVPENKGKKMSPEQYEKCKGTMFKKGMVPHNHKPVGYRMKNMHLGGYWIEKVAEPNVWKFVHRMIWEEHNGPIPDNCVITFADSNLDNLDISNLRCITRAEHSGLIQTGIANIGDSDLKDIGIGIQRIKSKLREKEKRA